MAQNYEIDIKRFNGQDYDTLLPTPASHASTHQADGSDPITVTNAMLALESVGTSKVINKSMTRAKLANDALYSPINSKTSDYTIDVTDLGKTIVFSSSSTQTITFDDSVALTLPTGSEIAIVRWGSGTANLVFSGEFWIAHIGDGWIKRDTDATVTVRIPERFGMIALKRMTSVSWLVTGDVEVV